MNALEFDRLVQKYQSLVYTICRQLVADEGYAQDLTQETFLSANIYLIIFVVILLCGRTKTLINLF